MKKITIDEVLGRERKLHWTFAVYKERIPQPNNTFAMNEVSEVTVNHYKTENEALEAVKKILVRPFYYLKSVWECTQCQTLDVQNELMKLAKKHLEE